MLHEVIKAGETKDYIQAACAAIEKGDFFGALVNIRKAIYVEIEDEYSIEGWKNVSKTEDGRKAMFLVAGGFKAPWYTKNKEWIDENVKDPFGYIQLDHEIMRLDLIEWGVVTQDFWNLWRLTPKVFRFRESKQWIIKEEVKHTEEAASETNAKYCLDKAISLIVKKQKHHGLVRFLRDTLASRVKVRINQDTPVYEKALKSSKVQENVQDRTVWDAESVITSGLDGKGKFVRILHLDADAQRVVSGYVDLNACEILDKPSETPK